MSNYPRRRITITACVLLGLGLALLQLPLLDKKSSRIESGRKFDAQKASAEVQNEAPKGGMVRLDEVQVELVNHKDTRATKQVLIINGQVPHVTGFTRAVFQPGFEIEVHSHESMDEVFYVQEGKGIVEIDGGTFQVSAGTCVHISAGTKHMIRNTAKEGDMILLYFGIDTGPATDGTRREGSVRALTPRYPD